MEVSIRKAELRDLGYIVELMKREKAALGFLPAIAVQEFLYTESGWMAQVAEEPVGYLLFRYPSTRSNFYRVTQLFVLRGWRRQGVGTELLRTAVHNGPGGSGWECKVRDDLEANQFWLACGFTWKARKWNNSRAQMWLNIYELKKGKEVRDHVKVDVHRLQKKILAGASYSPDRPDEGPPLLGLRTEAREPGNHEVE